MQKLKREWNKALETEWIKSCLFVTKEWNWNVIPFLGLIFIEKGREGCYKLLFYSIIFSNMNAFKKFMCSGSYCCVQSASRWWAWPYLQSSSIHDALLPCELCSLIQWTKYLNIYIYIKYIIYVSCLLMIFFLLCRRECLNKSFEATWVLLVLLGI